MGMPRSVLIALGLLLALVVGYIDYVTGPEISLAILYLLPVVLVTWFGSRALAMAMSVFSAAVWLTVDRWWPPPYSYPLIPYWNALVRLGFFLTVAFLLRAVRDMTRSLGATIEKRTAALTAEVADRRRTEAALRESEARFASAFEHAPIGMALVQIDGRMLRVNRALCQMLGYSEAALLGMNVMDITHADDLQTTADHARQLIERTLDAWHLEKRLRHADGHWVWALASSSLVWDAEGAPVYVISQVQNITDQKRAAEALRRSEQHFRALIENAQDLVAILDRDGTVRYASPSHHRILGYEADHVIGANAFQLAHPDDVPSLMQHLSSLLETPGTAVPLEFRFRHRDGSWHDLEVLARNLLDDPAVGGLVINSRDVTERKQVEVARRDSEERYRRLTENAHDLIAEIGMDGRILYASPNHSDVLGYDCSELMGLATLALIHPDDLAGIMAVMGDEHAQAVFRFRHKSGEWRWLEGTGRAFQSATGERRGVVISRDITARRQAEDKLIASENRLRSIIAAEPECVKIIAPDGTVLEMNPAGLAMIEARSPDQVVGKSVYPLISPEYRDAFRQITAQTCAGQPGTLEFKMRSLRGAERWADTRTVPLRDERNRIVGALGVTRDITARKRAEAAQRDEARILAALARIGHELMASLATPALLDRLCCVTAEVLECDVSYTLFLQSEDDVFRPIAGYGATTEERQIAQVMRVPRAAMAGLLAKLATDDVASVGTIPSDLLSGAEQQRLGVGLALCMALRRGAELIGLQVALSRDRRTGFSDIDARIARGLAQVASVALEHARVVQELERANRLKSDFVATMSHELRTPLSVIIGYTDLLADGAFGALQAEQIETVHRVGISARELLELINATLDLSRLEAGRVLLEYRQVVLPEVIHQLDDETRELQERSGLQFVWQVAPDLPAIHTDPVKLKLVLKNLIGNAVKFTDAGSITVRAQAQNGNVEIAVADTGIGIPAEALPIIFEPFRQADSSNTRRHGGVGLGLYIVRRLVELLGGTVAVDSQVGRGSTFFVSLPAHSEREA